MPVVYGGSRAGVGRVRGAAACWRPVLSLLRKAAIRAASTGGAVVRASANCGRPKRCQPVGDQYRTGTSRVVPLDGRGMHRRSPSGGARPVSRAQQRSRFSVAAAWAALWGSGSSRGHLRKAGSRSVLGRSRPWCGSTGRVRSAGAGVVGCKAGPQGVVPGNAVPEQAWATGTVDGRSRICPPRGPDREVRGERPRLCGLGRASASAGPRVDRRLMDVRRWARVDERHARDGHAAHPPGSQWQGPGATVRRGGPAVRPALSHRRGVHRRHGSAFHRPPGTRCPIRWFRHRAPPSAVRPPGRGHGAPHAGGRTPSLPTPDRSPGYGRAAVPAPPGPR